MPRRTRTLKVFCTEEEREDLYADFHAAEIEYDAFVLMKTTRDEVRRIGRLYPTEDITDLYKIRVGHRTIDTNRPRLDATGDTHWHPAYDNEDERRAIIKRCGKRERATLPFP